MAKKIFKGEVVSDKGNQSIVVLISYQYRDKKFKKIVRKSKRIMAHDPENTAATGDIVSIQECRPFSKMKRFQLLKVEEKGRSVLAL